MSSSGLMFSNLLHSSLRLSQQWLGNPALLFAVTIVSALVMNPKRIKNVKKRIFRRLQSKVKRKKNVNVNLGSIFGMDVGGTLTKIVYYQQKKPEDPNKISAIISTPLSPLPKRNSSDSLAQLEDPEHKAALEELYTYMDTTTQAAASNGVIRDNLLSVYCPYLDGQLHFLHFETRNMINAINYVSSSAFTQHIQSIGCTGGGAHKYSNEILETLEITVNKYDELGCLVRGMLFALTNFPDECYTYRNVEDDDDEIAAEGAAAQHDPSSNQRQSQNNSSSDTSSPPKIKIPNSVKRWQKDSKEYTKKVILPSTANAAFPYLVVNIGSGVSILKVSGPGSYERVSGTSLGGGTYWGLCRLLTNCATYEEVLDIAENGDAGTVDMLVKDIYGGDYGGLLSGSMVASSFGKLVMKENPREGVTEEDLALALLMMITNNIGQVAYLNAQLFNCTKIFFVGSFLRHNPISCRRLAFAIDFWSGGKMEALFLAHEGYFGALGTFFQSAFGEDVDKILNEYDRNNIVPFANESANTTTADCVEDNNSTAVSGTGSSGKKTGQSPISKAFDFKDQVKNLSMLWDRTTGNNSRDSSHVSGEATASPAKLRRGRSVSDDVTFRSESAKLNNYSNSNATTDSSGNK